MKRQLNLPDKNYFLFLLPVFFVWHGYTENAVVVPAADALVLLLQYLVATALLWLLFFTAFRSWRRSALFCFALLCYQFFFGPVHDFLKSVFGDSLPTKYAFILPLSLIAFVILFIYLRRKKLSFARFARYANLLLVVLILVDLVNFVRHLPAAPEMQRPKGFSDCDSCKRPDIYLIVADEYAGHAELSDVFHYDNSGFENALRQRGFFIVPSSKSNYNSTPFSMASMLDMRFIEGIEEIYRNKKGQDKAYSIINRNTTLDFLRYKDYEIRNYSIFSLDNDPPLRAQGLLVTGVRRITTQTFLSRANRDIAFNLVTKLNIGFLKQKVLNVDLRNNEFFIEKLKREAGLAAEKKPKFVYTHLMMPHYPFYYDSLGNRLHLEDFMPATDAGRQQQYVSYLKYANAKFLELVDRIQQHVSRPTIIVLMGDHGFREFVGPIDRKYHFMNLNAVYLPSRNYAGFYEGMSNVNQFRTIFNAEFGQQLPMLKDSTSDLEK